MLNHYLVKINKYIKPYIRIENIFLFIFLIFGTLFIAITPPGQNPDEMTHFNRAWQIADFNLRSDVIIADGEKLIGGYLPTNIELFFNANKISNGVDKDFKFNNLNHTLITDLDVNSEQKFVDFRGSALYSPIAYIPSAPAALMGQLFDFPIIVTFYLMRIFSMFIVGALLYIAIRIIPIAKWPLAILCLTPSLIAQAVAVSADGIIISLCFLYIAYTLNLALQKRTITLPKLTILLFLISCIGLAKITYLPLILCVALIPILNVSQRRWKPLLILSMTVLIATIIPLVWMKTTGYIDTQNGPGSNLSLQKSFVFENPLLYLKTLYYTFLTNQNTGTTPHLWIGFFGNFGYLTAPLPTLFAFVSVITLTISIFLKSPREIKWKPKNKTLVMYRTLLVLTISAVIGAISTALYLYYTSVKSSTVSGLQGRYFLPIAPLILLFFYGNTLLYNQKKTKIGIFVACVVVLSAAVFTAYSRYYLSLPPVLT
jgi:uncharacterized membrane protein